MHTCLLVIDAQASFTRRPCFTAGAVVPYLAAQNVLIEGCEAAGVPIVQVFHESTEGGADDPFVRASGLLRPLEGLRAYAPALTLHKRRHSALVGTGLDVWCVEQGVQRLIVSGIRTEQCCETTARHASDLGWHVLFVDEATLTWDITMPGGTRISAAALHERTAAVLHDRFARVLTVQEALRDVAAH